MVDKAIEEFTPPNALVAVRTGIKKDTASLLQGDKSLENILWWIHQ